MKYLILIIAFFTVFSAQACECSIVPLTQHYQDADFVAVGKIIMVYPNESEEELYQADIQITDLIKGPMISSIYVRGRSDGEMGSSCSIYTPENTEYIFFGKKDESDRITFGACSGTRNLEYVKKKSSYLLDLLKILKSYQEEFSGYPYIINWSTLSDILKKFEGEHVKEKYALYEVQFKKNLKVRKVKILKSFGKESDEVIVDGLINSIWRNQYAKDKSQAPKGTKKLVGIFYYQAEGNNPSFLSEFDL